LIKDTRNAVKSGGLPPKKEQKPAYVPNKKPLIDDKLWNNVKDQSQMARAVEAAVDAQINNFIEDALVEFHNIEKYQKRDVNNINKSLKQSKGTLNFEDINSRRDFDDISDDKSKSMRDSTMSKNLNQYSTF